MYDTNNTTFKNSGKTATRILSASDYVKRIKDEVNCVWHSNTVDTFKAGDPETPVTGIACTFIASLDVIRKAVDLNCNLIITHEPVFYNHFDETGNLGNDPAYNEKLKLIKDNNLVIWRFHDHWHRNTPDGITEGLLRRLHWEKFVTSRDPVLLEFPEMFAGEFLHRLKRAFGQSPVRLVGNPSMPFRKAVLAPGSPGIRQIIRLLGRDDVDLLITGEESEWGSVGYLKDLNSIGKPKAMILLGHANSEEAGMKYCAEWLRTFIQSVPVHFVAAGDPFNPGL